MVDRPHHEVFEGTELGPWQPVGDVDVSRLDLPTKIFGAASLALFFSLQLPWYTRGGGAVAGSASAMAAGGWRWLIWLLALGSAVFVFLESVTSLRLPAFLTDARQRGQLFVAAAGVNLLLVLLAAFAVKAQPPSLVPLATSTPVSTALGAYLGLLWAIVAMAAAVRGYLVQATSTAVRPAPANPATPASPPSGPVYGPTPDPPSSAPGQGGPTPPAAGSRAASGPPAGPDGSPRVRQRPAAPGSDPPTGWMPPQPPPPPPL